MSTNKTQNYQLHAWEAGDDFLLSEINENFTKLDTDLYGLLATGTYKGDGEANRLIELGFTPRAVLLMTSTGEAKSTSYYYGGLAVTDGPNPVVFISEGGFTVIEGTSAYTANNSRYTYYYLALR